MYKVPKWVKSIPKSTAHGSGELQQRLWRVCSDYVRLRDWYQYHGRCVATGEYIPTWQQGNAGHYYSYSICNSMFKFDIWNIHLQSATSNAWGGQSIGHAFGEELKRRYGDDFLEELRKENQSWIGKKVDNELVINEILDILDLMKSLPEKPEYFDKVITKIENE